VSSGR